MKCLSKGNTICVNTQDPKRQIYIYENFNNIVTTSCLSKENEYSKEFYIDIEKVSEDENLYIAREAYKFTFKNESQQSNDEDELINYLSIPVNRVRIFCDDWNKIKFVLPKNNYNLSYCNIHIYENYIELYFPKDNKSYNDLRKHIYILEYFFKFMLGRDFKIGMIKVYMNVVEKYSVFFSRENSFKEIKGVLSQKEKLDFLNSSDVQPDTFFEKWFYFFSNRDSQQLLNGLRQVYVSYPYSKINKNIQEAVSLIEGIFISVASNSSRIKLRDKLKIILDDIAEQEKNKHIANIKNFSILSDDNDIEKFVQIRHKGAHNLPNKLKPNHKKEFLYELLLSSIKLLELYLILTIKECERKKIIEKSIKHNKKTQKC